MEIKILVPENRESDLDNFIKDCENKGFELQNRGGGHMPSFSGYYATLKGKNWKFENNGWIKSIAISHQKQMSSTHPHAIIGTIEDAIIEALETFKSNQ